MRRVRHPLPAPIVLVAALVIGYAIKAITSGHDGQRSGWTPWVSVVR